MCCIVLFLFGAARRYLASTEEGPIHRCSLSYNEQFLKSYFFHTVRTALHSILLRLDI